ncbi:MAG: hypothetical protein JPMHGGIA_01078 [Saprospiraceae bacterium]|jgi:hypothetical protein|nr:hypothetical protein [Saprospiraceae bacterium]
MWMETISRTIIATALHAAMITAFTPCASSAQEVVQFSGKVYAADVRGSEPLPYAQVAVPRIRQATYTNELGFFSLAVRAGDTLQLSFLGFKTQWVAVPSAGKGASVYEEFFLQRDTFELEPATVYAIPSREHFRPEFLAMEVKDDARAVAEKNLSPEVLAWIEPGVPADPGAALGLYFRQEATNAVYRGQFKPTEIFNPLAWIKFIEALKRGDFKKKKSKPPE